MILRNGPRALLLGLLLAVALHGSSAQAQKQDGDVLSKEDARLLFAMSRQQWEENVNTAVRAGFATPHSSAPTMIGMQVTAPRGHVITELDYSRGPTKPRSIHLVLAYPAGSGATPYTDASARELLAHTRKQMAPEFDVTGNVERIEGGFAFFFTIRERGAR